MEMLTREIAAHLVSEVYFSEPKFAAIPLLFSLQYQLLNRLTKMEVLSSCLSIPKHFKKRHYLVVLRSH